jgi:hypothetical protein
LRLRRDRSWIRCERFESCFAAGEEGMEPNLNLRRCRDMGRGGADETLRAREIVVPDRELNEGKAIFPVLRELLESGEKWLLVDHGGENGLGS